MAEDNQDHSGGILEGIRIIDMSTGIAGPVATMLLAEVGADVVKVEAPVPGPDRREPGFRTWNRSKRSVASTSASEEGKASLEQPAGGGRRAGARPRADGGRGGRASTTPAWRPVIRT